MTADSWKARIFLAASLLSLVVLPGCVRRRLLVKSNPPGATVYVDNQPIGQTPCATNFIYYGTREIRLVKPGYETLTINQPIPAPWYEIPPLDFISENLVPREIQDYRTLSYNLQPQVVVPTDQLLGRAQQLRASTQIGSVAPAGALVPGATPGLTPLGSPVLQPTLAPELGVPQPGVLGTPIPQGGVLPPGGRTVEPLPPAR
ncbi:MAG: PEGA domain-containing protein [Lacipirellulaceae bacterium]